MILQGIVLMFVGISLVVIAFIIANKDIKYDKKHNNTKYSEGLHAFEMLPILLFGGFIILIGFVLIVS